MSSSMFVIAILGLNVALSEWLAHRTWLRHLGSALLVIVITAAMANAGLIPAYTDDVPVYNGIFEYLAPLAIFLLLLRVHLRGLLGVGLPMLVLFGLGMVGTAAGVFSGDIYTALIMVIAYTTLLAPFWIKLYYRVFGKYLE